MKNLFLTLFCLSLILTACENAQRNIPTANQGVIDLSGWDFEKDGSINLDGDWEFYWNKLLEPSDFIKDTMLKPSSYAKVRGIWNKINIDGKKLPGTGCATYRLVVKGISKTEGLAIKTYDASSAFRLYVNDKLEIVNGVVSENTGLMKPQYLPEISQPLNLSGELIMTVQVANNFHSKGGLWESISLGSNEKLIRKKDIGFIYDMFLIGILFILFVYHLWIYFLRRSEIAALGFGLTCFIMFTRTLVTGNRLLFFLFPDISLNIGLRLEYLLFCLPAPLSVFIQSLFPKDFSKKLLTVINVVSILLFIIIFFTPTKFYTSQVEIMQIWLMTVFGYIIIISFKAVFNKRPFSVLFCFIGLLMIAAAVNDILFSQRLVNTANIAPYVFIVFVLLQAYILANRMAGAIHTIESLSAEISEANVTLEQKIKERTHDLETQKKKADDLLLNILPRQAAEELQLLGHSEAKTFSMVSVLFADFVDFTRVSEKVSAELLVAEIDHCFSAFDEIIQKHNVEKIKTVGDAYICVGGMPVLTFNHAADTINAAIEIRSFIQMRKIEKETKGEIPFEIRLGIHTGPVVAGIVGQKKFAYDIWGDTVNLAARMEQNSEAGKINISGSTFELVKDKFACTHRGKIDAKNKGQIDMYFVNEKG